MFNDILTNCVYQGKQALAPIPKQPAANQNGHEEDEHVQEQVPAVPAPPKAKRGRGEQSCINVLVSNQALKVNNLLAESNHL